MEDTLTLEPDVAPESTFDAPDTAADTTVDSTAEETADTAAQPEEEQEAVIDGKKLSDKARATLESIKTTDPKLATQLKSALFAADVLKREFPGGLREIQQAKQQLESVGGFDGIRQIQEELKGWESVDEKYTKADPSFVQDIAEGDPVAFAALAPHVFAKFSEISPDGYGSYIANVMMSDMASNQIPIALARLQDFLGDDPRAQQAFKTIADYYNRVGTLARQQVKPVPAKTSQPVDQRVADLDQREQQFTRNQWTVQAQTQRASVYNAEFAAATKNLKLTDTQKAAIEELYISRLKANIAKIPNLNETLEKYYKNKDQQGYLRYIATIDRQQIPIALKSAISAIVPTRKAAAATTINGNGTARNTTQAEKPEAGFVFGANPAANDIDYTRTDRKMILAGRAVLKSGKKVYWRK